MKRLEILAASPEEAKEKALEQGIEVIADVTRTWQNEGYPLGTLEFRVFAAEQMERYRITHRPSEGLMVTVVPCYKNKRKKPYKVKNYVHNGKKDVQRVVEVRLKDTDELVGEASVKKDAIEIAKELMPKYKTAMVGTYAYRFLEGKGKAFDIEYTPSKGSKQGKYIVFGNERNML